MHACRYCRYCGVRGARAAAAATAAREAEEAAAEEGEGAGRSSAEDASSEGKAEGGRGSSLAGIEIVGRRIEVFWPMDREWYEAEVLQYVDADRTHLLEYVMDGEQEYIKLAVHDWRLSAGQCKPAAAAAEALKAEEAGKGEEAGVSWRRAHVVCAPRCSHLALCGAFPTCLCSEHFELRLLLFELLRHLLLL